MKSATNHLKIQTDYFRQGPNLTISQNEVPTCRQPKSRQEISERRAAARMAQFERDALGPPRGMLPAFKSPKEQRKTTCIYCGVEKAPSQFKLIRTDDGMKHHCRPVCKNVGVEAEV